VDLRRIALGGLVALPLAVGGGLAVTELYVPAMVRDRLGGITRDRLGLETRVGAVSVGFGSVELEDVIVGDAKLGVRLHARRVRLEGSVLLAGLRGPRHLDAIRVQGAELELMADTAGVRNLRERLSQTRDTSAAGESAPARLPSLELTGLTARLADARGSLVSVGDGAASLVDGQLELRAAMLQVGGGDAHRLTLEGCRAMLQRVPSGLALRTGQVREARLELAAGPSVTGALDADRADGAPLAAPAPREPDGVEGRLAADAANGDALLLEDPPAAAVPGVVARLTALWGDPAPATERVAAERAAATREAGATGSRSLRFDQTSSLTLGSGQISGVGGRLLDGLTLQASAGEAGALRVKGGGRGARGGKLQWDMRVWPSELRADGELMLDALSLGLLAPLLPRIPWHEPERASVTARIVVKTESVQRLTLTGRAELRGAAIASERVAPVPVTGIDLSVEGEGHFLPLQRRLEIDSARLRLGEATVDLEGALEWAHDHYLVAVDATLPPLACTAAIRALPRDLLADMAQAEFNGTIGGKLHVVLDSRQLEAGELEFDVADRCEFVAVPVMADLRRFKMPFVHSVVEPDGSVFEMDTGPGTAKWTYLDDVSPFLVHAVLAHEDTQFFSHEGFAPAHIRNALIKNLQEGRYVVGASTITMQLVKNIFLRREKTLARKIQEVLLTWWIERVLDKPEIMELYLNVIEYGPGVYGIRDGARHYFNRLPSELSPAEAVYLSTILPNPKRYHAAFERGSLSPGWLDKMRKILKRMRERSWYDAQAVDYGLKELEAFRFVPEGTIAPPRHVVGSAAPLPYQLGAGEGWESLPGAAEELAPDQWEPDGDAASEP
jgi:hypothetical protein